MADEPAGPALAGTRARSVAMPGLVVARVRVAGRAGEPAWVPGRAAAPVAERGRVAGARRGRSLTGLALSVSVSCSGPEAGPGSPMVLTSTRSPSLPSPSTGEVPVRVTAA